MKIIGKFKLSALAILSFTTSATCDGDPSSYEKILLDDAPGAPDTDGTTHGQTRDGWGWNCLVRREYVDLWTSAAAHYGYDVEIVDAHVGHYGDGHYAGADLAQDPRDEESVYWIDLEG